MSRVAKKGSAARKRYSDEFKKEALGLADRVGVAKAYDDEIYTDEING